MAKKWSQAGQAFCEAANLHAKAGSRHDAATNYIDASNCFKKSEPNGLFFIHKIGTSSYTKN
jgi:alpha-soluble NSF attachment protein